MSEISAGTRLGPYEIVAPLGAGGMGEVWRARDTRLDRTVAIKLLPAELAHDSQLKIRFEREARAISQLNHPNICTLYDVGDSYLVMELLDGQSLADRLTRGALPMGDVFRLGAQIADALDKAHRAGIVHRDLKPGNIMITTNGAKLLDFGLAKSAAGDVAGFGGMTMATAHKPLTQEGTIVGTFQYMAPEQLEGVEADARTDIFALGAVLYEMATGTRAFAGKTRTSLIAAIVSGEPRPISAIQPVTPPALEHIVQKCLEKNPDDRWQSAHDVAQELRWAASAPDVRQRSSRGWLPWSIAALLGVAAVLLGMRVMRPATIRPYRFAVPGIEAGSYKYASIPMLGPDGRTLFFRASAASGGSQLFRRALDDWKAVAIEGTQGAFGFRVSPDGRTIVAIFSGAIIKRIPVNGGPPQTLTDAALGGGTVAIGLDGTVLVASGSAPIRRIAPDGKLVPAVSLDTATGESSHDAPFFLPDGKHFLFVAVHRDVAKGGLKRILKAASLDSSEVVTIGEVSSRAEYAKGHLFSVRESSLIAEPFDVKKLKVTGDPIVVCDDVSFNSRTGAASFTTSPDGTIAVQSPAFGIRATWVDDKGVPHGTVGKPVTTNRGVAVVHNPDRIVMSVPDLKLGNTYLWVFDVGRETGTRLTYGSAMEISPAVTPDGNRVYFASDVEPGIHIYEAPIDGSMPPKLVVRAANLQQPMDVSPDGRFLLYQSNENQAVSRQDIWALPLTEGAKPYPVVATPAVESSGVFSPDGRWIAYVSDVSGLPQVYLKPFAGPGAARLVSATGGAAPRFTPDGKHLLFADEAKIMSAAVAPNGVTAEPQLLFTAPERVLSIQIIGDRYLLQLQNDADASPPMRIITDWQPSSP